MDAVIKSEHPKDRLSSTKTIYDASAGEIFIKQFIAGMARALGGILMYAAFLVLFAQIIAQVIWPQIEPFISQYQQLMNSFTTQSPTQTVDQDTVNQILNQIQK